MSDAARWMIAFAFISLPTIAFGGYFLLSILKRQAGTENVTSEQRDYFRAGHAHAGVLVLLAIVGQLVLDESRFSESITWALRIGLVAAPLLISGGFFVCDPRVFGVLNDQSDLVFEQEPIKSLVAKKELAVYQHDGFWQCMDTARDWQLLNTLLSTNQAPWKTW